MKKIPYFHLILVIGFLLILVGYRKFSPNGVNSKPTSGVDTAQGQVPEGAPPLAIIASPVQAQEAEERVVIDAKGMPYYINMQEADGVSTCYDECAETWIPMTFAMEDEVFSVPETYYDIDIVEREDGSYQATYKGYPLYWYAGDQTPEDRKGHQVGSWVVATIE